jgi:hypothetical protein
MQWTLLQLLEKFLSVHNKRRTCSQHWPLQTWTSWSNLHNSRIDCNVQRYTLNRRDPGAESRENYIPDNFYFWPQLDPEWKQRPRFILHITQTRRTKLTRVLPWPMPWSWICWYPIRSRESPGINLMNHRVRKLSSERDFFVHFEVPKLGPENGTYSRCHTSKCPPFSYPNVVLILDPLLGPVVQQSATTNWSIGRLLFDCSQPNAHPFSCCKPSMCNNTVQSIRCNTRLGPPCAIGANHVM